MSFMSIYAPGLLQESDSVRIERMLQARIDRLISALDRVMPEGIRFSDWYRYEDSELHVDLQVDGPVQQHVVALAEFLATGAGRVHDRYFAAFRREKSFVPLAEDALWLAVNTAVHAIETAGGQIRFHADKPHERQLTAVDPEFLRVARTWDDIVRVEHALLVGLTVFPTLVQGGRYSILLSVDRGTRPFAAVVPEELLDALHPGRTRVSFEYVQDPGGVCAVVLQTLLLHSAEDRGNLAVCDVSP